MEIHNLMEDEVLKVVDEICEEDERTHVYGYCSTPECRMDAACFVLNRVPQQYVTSSRGLAYVQSEFRTNPQLSVDLVTLAHEGLRRVNAVKRSYYFPEENGTSTASVDGGPRFHYPAIRGRLFDCLTFAPVSGVDVWLRVDDKPVRMINSRWQNPYGLLDSSSGSYLFWPESSPADGKESRRVFEFELFVDESKRFEEFRHYFKIEVTASADADETLRLTRDFRLQDLFLVPR